MTYKTHPGQAWSLYTNTIPVGSTPIGTVTQPTGETGALVKMPTGLYVQINAGNVKNLPQPDIKKALGIPAAGRPALPDRRVKMTVSIRPELASQLRQTENISRTVEIALTRHFAQAD